MTRPQGAPPGAPAQSEPRDSARPEPPGRSPPAAPSPARRSAAGTLQRGPAGAAAAPRRRQPAAYQQRSLLGQFCGVFLLHLKLSGENPGSGPRLPQARAEPPRQKRPLGSSGGALWGKRFSSLSVSLSKLPFFPSPPPRAIKQSGGRMPP